MKRFTVLPLLLFFFACGDTTTEPAMDDTLQTIAALDANPESEGVQFVFEEGYGLIGVWWEDEDNGNACGVFWGDIEARKKIHKAAEQIQLKLKSHPFTARYDGINLAGEGRVNVFDLQSDAWLQGTGDLHFLLHANGEHEDAAGNRYQVTCRIEIERVDGEIVTGYRTINISPK